MSLEKKIIPAIKDAMMNKDRIMLEVLRGIKSEIIKFKTSANGKQELNSNQEIGIIKKMIKQRKESALYIQIKIEVIWLILRIVNLIF